MDGRNRQCGLVKNGRISIFRSDFCICLLRHMYGYTRVFCSRICLLYSLVNNMVEFQLKSWFYIFLSFISPEQS